MWPPLRDVWFKVAYEPQNQGENPILIRLTITKQLMKMFHNCAIAQIGVILELFQELLCSGMQF